jgi:hypothetical protein
MRDGFGSCIAIGFFLGLGITLGIGCTGIIAAVPSQYDYFSIPDPRDAWSPKISGWQKRERVDDGSFFADQPIVWERPNGSVAASVAEAGAVEPGTEPAIPEFDFMPDSGLRGKYFDFRADRRRTLARELASWIQGESHSHYVPDGPIDHWATLEETLRRNGDDCDGLELLVYHALRDLGFAANEVYRAIVFRPSDGQHHMVTLWFENRNDPWVIDPTGAMTLGMPRMSELPEWTPLKVFSESIEYTVRDRTESLSQIP